MRILLTFILLVLFSNVNADEDNSSSSIALNQEYLENKSEDVISYWMIYGFALQKWKVEYTEDRLYDFYNRELFARKFMLDVRLHSKKEQGVEPDIDLDVLEKIYESGFIKEYIWFYLAESNWQQPHDLELDKFQKWSQRNLKNHIPVLKAVYLSDD
jgi:hypothetical protein